MQWRAYNRHYDGIALLRKADTGFVAAAGTAGSAVCGKLCSESPAYSILAEHEWILKTLLLLPERDATLAYQWLMEQFERSEHNEPGRADDDLCGRGVEKVSPFWSDAQFDQMERRVVFYHSPDMLENARDRFSLKAYWPYWGSLQEALLPAMGPAKQKQSAASCAAASERTGFWRCMV